MEKYYEIPDLESIELADRVCSVIYPGKYQGSRCPRGIGDLRGLWCTCFSIFYGHPRT